MKIVATLAGAAFMTASTTIALAQGAGGGGGRPRERGGST